MVIDKVPFFMWILVGHEKNEEAMQRLGLV